MIIEGKRNKVIPTLRWQAILCRVSDGPDFSHQTLLHLMNLLVILTLACYGLSFLIRTMFSDIYFNEKNYRPQSASEVALFRSLSLPKTPELCSRTLYETLSKCA